MNKYLSFLKNAGIATAVAVASGVASSEITKEFTDNGKIIGVAATLAQYISSWAAFLPLQARDNKAIYTENSKFNVRKFLWDNAKYAGSFLLLDAVYLAGRPFLQDYFFDRGMNAGKSSLVTDVVCMPCFLGLSIGLARLTGVIKSKKDLEKITNEPESTRASEI